MRFLSFSSFVLAALGCFTSFAAIPNYPCYRTVEETFTTAQVLAFKHPNLASWIDIGDSWEKTAGEGGWDLMVLRLTNRSIPGPKPTLFATSAIHAREYATAELMTRFAEKLINGYGKDPDITWMLDHHEAHLLLIMNPDGRKKAEPQVMWRKNTNRAYCGSASNSRGVDLNRNFDYQWGNVGSSDQCSETYRGPKAASEPEVQAVQNYLRKLFPDKKTSPSSPAPLDYQGIYLDIHSYGEIIYQPVSSPNNKEITTLNRKFGFFNGHEPILSRGTQEAQKLAGQRSDREYHARNHTYDFGYGDLGVPSYLFELGTEFFQSCQYFEQSILPGNINALMYAMRVLRAPYLLPSGPEITALSVSRFSSTRLELIATLDDTKFSTKAGTEPSQNITSAEIYLNTPPWVPGAQAIVANAKDGKFDSKVELISALIDTTALAAERHTVFVRGKDAAGNWGPVRALFIDP